jgi:hypothetical protein
VLAVVYVVIGLACAMPELLCVPKVRTPGQRIYVVASSFFTVILWPLWAPFALTPRSPKRRPPRRSI